MLRTMRSNISKNIQALKYLVIKAKGATRIEARVLSGVEQQGFLVWDLGVDFAGADSIFVVSSVDFDEAALLCAMDSLDSADLGFGVEFCMGVVLVMIYPA